MTCLTALVAITCFFIIIEAATNPLNDQTREKRQYHHYHRNHYHHRHDVDGFDYDNIPAQPLIHRVHERIGGYHFGGQINYGFGFPGGFSNPQGPPHGRYGPPDRRYGPSGQGYGPPGRGHGPPGRGPPGHNRGPPGHNHGPPGHFGGPPGHQQGRWPPGRRGKPRFPNPNNIDFKFPEKREKHEEVDDGQSKVVAYVDDNFPVILLSDDDIRR